MWKTHRRRRPHRWKYYTPPLESHNPTARKLHPHQLKTQTFDPHRWNLQLPNGKFNTTSWKHIEEEDPSGENLPPPPLRRRGKKNNKNSNHSNNMKKFKRYNLYFTLFLRA